MCFLAWVGWGCLVLGAGMWQGQTQSSRAPHVCEVLLRGFVSGSRRGRRGVTYQAFPPQLPAQLLSPAGLSSALHYPAGG